MHIQWQQTKPRKHQQRPKTTSRMCKKQTKQITHVFKNDSKHKYNLSTYPFNERKSVKQQFSVNPFEVKPQKLTTQT